MFNYAGGEVKLKVSAIQLKFLSLNEQHDYIAKEITKAAEISKLVVLPELHNTNYFCQEQNIDNFNLAETIPGPSTDFFAALSKKLKIVLVISLFEKTKENKYFNTAVVLDNGKIAGKYRKTHIPDDPGYNEKFYFTPGDLGCNPIETSVGKLGVLICWDQWFPEAARQMVQNGAEILIYPTAIGFEPNDSHADQQKQLEAWVTIQRAHAIANGVYVISCNRICFEDAPKNRNDLSGINFWGNSFICGPQGEFLARASTDKCEIISAEIDLNHSKKVQHLWHFSRDL